MTVTANRLQQFFFNYKWSLGAASAMTMYLILSCYDLRLPGANYDEMLYQAPAVNFLSDSVRTEPMQINPSVMYLFGKPLPLMLMTYIGSVKVIWHIVIFAAFGISVETARLGSVFLGLFVLVYTFLFLRSLFNERTAFITVLLMASSAEYVFYTSRDMTIVFMLLAKMAALYHLLIYCRYSQLIHFFMGGIWLGLGLYDKASFLWFIITLILWVLIFHFKKIRSIPRRHFALAASGFFASSVVFIVFNFIRLGETFIPMITDFSKTSGGVDNTDILSNFYIRMEQFFALLNGNGLLNLFAGVNSSDLLIRILPWLIVLLMTLFIILLLFRRLTGDRKKLTFVIFFLIVPLFQTIFTPSALSLHHVAIAWPFHLVMVAISIIWIAKLTHSFAISVLPAVTITTLIVTINIFSVFSIYQNIKTSGSAGNWSETIYELNDYLTEKNEPVYLMTWGFTNNLIVTSGGKLSMIRLYREFMKADPVEKRLIIMTNLQSGKSYLFSVNQPDYRKTEKMFLEECRISHYTAGIEKRFLQKDGNDLYILYQLK